MNTKRRTELRKELLSQGYSAGYVDSWQPKVNMWRHGPFMNNEGAEVFPAGMAVPNQPGHPEHALSNALKGVLPWKPGPTCQCKACRHRYGTVRDDTKFMAPADITQVADSSFGTVPSPNGELTAPVTVVGGNKVLTTVTASLPFSGPSDCLEHRKGFKNAAGLRVHRQHKHKGEKKA